MAKKVLLGVAAAAIVSIGYFVIAGWPPAQQGAEGTIQAAKRHRAEQIKNQDVVLQDPEIQDLLQTDFFRRIVTDKSFQKMVADGSLRRIDLNDLAVLSQALGHAEFRDALGKGNMAAAMQAVEKVGLGMQQLDKAELKAFLGQALGHAELRAALGKGDLEAVVQAAQKVELGMQQLQNAELKDLLASAQMQSFLDKQDVNALVTLGRVEFHQALSHAAFGKLLVNAAFQQAMIDGNAASFIGE